MADINLKPEIALGIQSSNPLTSLGQTVQTAAGLQEFIKARELLPYAIEAGKAQTQTAKTQAEKALLELKQSQMQTDLASIEFAEQKGLMNLINSPELYQGADGRPDLNKLNKIVPLIAPRTGSKFLKDYTELNAAQITAAEAKNKLDTNIRGIIAGPLGILGQAGIKDKTKYIDALTQLKSEYANNKDVGDYVDSRIKLLEKLPADANLPQMALLESQSLLSPTEQRGLAPQVGTVSTGSTIQPVVTTPSVLGNQPTVQAGGGNPIPINIAPGQQAAIETDRNGNLMIVYRDARGNIVNTSPLPAGGQPVPQGGQPAPGQPQPAQPGQQQSYSPNMPPLRYPVRPQGSVVTNMLPQEKADLEANTKYRAGLQNQQNNMTTSRRNLDEVMATATGLEENSWFTSGVAGAVSRNFRNWAGDPTYKMLSKDLANVAISNIQAMGGSMDTVSGQQLTRMANGDETYPPEVLIKIAKRTYADLTNIDMQASGANAFANKYGEANLNSFKQAWAANADSKVFELINMYKAAEGLEGKKKEKALLEIKSFVGTGKQAENILQKYKNIKKLSETGEL